MLLRCGLALLVLHGAWAQRRPFPVPSARVPAPPAARQQQQQPQASSDILEQVSDISPDGSFHTKWTSSNGISFEEFGQPKNLGQEVVEEVQGSASWTSAEGEPVSISWHADENGAVIQGDHVPTAPPLPPLIQRALDYIAANPPRSAEEGAYVAEAAQAGPLRPSAGLSAFTTRRPVRPRRSGAASDSS